MKPHDRFLWAVEVLRIQPGDEVLEIGCGTGVAACMVAEKLVRGHVTAIDRSRAMISKAETLVPSDKARFLQGRLEELPLPRRRFSKAFAFNVSSFWKAEASRELAVLRLLLKPTGTFYLFHQPPTSAKTDRIVRESSAYLEAAGFLIEEVVFEDIAPARASCLVSRPRKASDSGGARGK